MKNKKYIYFKKDEERKEGIAENECGCVTKSPLAEGGRVVSSGERGELVLTTIMWLNQIPARLFSPLLLCVSSEFGPGHMFRYGCW